MASNFKHIFRDIHSRIVDPSIHSMIKRLFQKFFYYVGYLFSSYEVRKKCNGHLKRFKIKNPKSSRKERSKAFIEAVGKCAKVNLPTNDFDHINFTTVQTWVN